MSSSTGLRVTSDQRAVSSAAATAHSSRVSSPASCGTSARSRRVRSFTQGSGRKRRQLTGTLSSSLANHTPNACCPWKTCPRSGSNRRSTPTECSPAFGIGIGRTTHACGQVFRSRYRASAARIGCQSQVELDTKWCRLCSAAGPPICAAMLRIDLRPCAVSRPCRYCSAFSRWSRRGKPENSAAHSSA